jgi:CDP-6-deoxy-D-xylo-4-hexulose-3-dehydrase
MTPSARDLRNQILELVRRYHQQNWPERKFRPGEDPVPVSGKVFDAEELVCLVDSSLDFWLTAERYAHAFEKAFAEFIGTRYCLCVNSGSSANLLAVASLTSPELGERRLRPGNEVITVAAGFPTTVSPIIQSGLVPVFVDVDIPTYNVVPGLLEEAINPRTQAIILAHTLGNPFDLDTVVDLAIRHGLWLIEDSSDAIGATYNDRLVGTFGDLATASFYPAHHLTMGEGGAVLTGDPTLHRIARSMRDWGRECWCLPGRDNTCGRRFQHQSGQLPYGFDHKYVYSHLGYNLKITEMQAAIGLAQLQKLPEFIQKRKDNFALLSEGLKDLDQYIILPRPTPKGDPSWFGFPITLRPDPPLSRNHFVAWLESKKIATRLLFGGNLTRQPAFRDQSFRIVGELVNTDLVMTNTLWIGLYPGLTADHIGYVIEVMRNYFKKSI